MVYDGRERRKNGITISTNEHFLKLEPQQQLLLVFEALVEMKQTLACRLEECDKRFVTKKQAKSWGYIVLAFLAGLGLLNGWPFIAQIIK